MALMLAKTYAALKAAGAPEEDAQAAAEELADYDNRLANIEGDLRVLKWMVGTLYPLVLAILAKLFLH